MFNQATNEWNEQIGEDSIVHSRMMFDATVIVYGFVILKTIIIYKLLNDISCYLILSIFWR